MSVGTLVANPELRSMVDAWFAKFARPGMCNPADQTAVVTGDPVPAQAEADTRSPAQRQHDARPPWCAGNSGTRNWASTTAYR